MSSLASMCLMGLMVKAYSDWMRVVKVLLVDTATTHSLLLVRITNVG